MRGGGWRAERCLLVPRGPQRRRTRVAALSRSSTNLFGGVLVFPASNPDEGALPPTLFHPRRLASPQWPGSAEADGSLTRQAPSDVPRPCGVRILRVSALVAVLSPRLSANRIPFATGGCGQSWLTGSGLSRAGRRFAAWFQPRLAANPVGGCQGCNFLVAGLGPVKRPGMIQPFSHEAAAKGPKSPWPRLFLQTRF